MSLFTTSVRARVRHIVALAVAAGALVLAPAATASISPSLTLDQSAGTSAGSSVNLGMDLHFAPTGGDSTKDLTLTLPPGLLANASVGRGACLHSATPLAACKVGTGTVTATPFGLGLLPLSLPIEFDLVAPPKPGDLAGLALLVNGSQLGAPGEITVRPTSDPAGVGLNIAFSAIPDTYAGLPISLQELKSTLDSMRMPTSCPATPASLSVAADSYNAPSSVKTVAAPVQVTGCAQLPYTPGFQISAVKDMGDSGVQVTTDVTQPAAPAQATSRSVRLAFPAAVLIPNVAAVLNGGILCANPASGSCKPVGSATSVSPLYPAALSGKAYLTGSLTAPAVTIVFPPPFALTLAGPVDLATNSTTFGNVPDIPLTNLEVTLSGGPDAVFAASCAQPSGIATSTLTSQNGDRTVALSVPFTVAQCTAPAVGPGGGSPPPQPGGHRPGSHKPSRPRIALVSVAGLARGAPALSLRVVAGAGAPKLKSLTIVLPRGLTFVTRRKLRGISVSGAVVQSVVLKRGRLVVTLRRPAAGVLVKIGPGALRESHTLQVRARHHHVGTLKFTVLIVDAAGARSTATLPVRIF